MEIPGFCKVGTGYNRKINMQAHGFIAVTDSVHFLRKLEFAAVFVDEAHHPLPPGMPICKELFKFSATQKEEVNFRYSLGEAIEQGVLCDYDLHGAGGDRTASLHLPREPAAVATGAVSASASVLQFRC